MFVFLEMHLYVDWSSLMRRERSNYAHAVWLKGRIDDGLHRTMDIPDSEQTVSGDPTGPLGLRLRNDLGVSLDEW